MAGTVAWMGTTACCCCTSSSLSLNSSDSVDVLIVSELLECDLGEASGDTHTGRAGEGRPGRPGDLSVLTLAAESNQ